MAIGQITKLAKIVNELLKLPTVDGGSVIGAVDESYACVADMKARSIKAGRSVRTTAYHNGWAAEIGTPDGGAVYTVVTPSEFNVMMGNSSGPTARGNGGFNGTAYTCHTLANGNIAVPVTEGIVRVTVSGARSTTHTSVSQHEQLLAAHSWAWKIYKGTSAMFNGGKSRGFAQVHYCGKMFYTNQTIYAVYDSDAIGTPDGGAGAQIDTCHGGLIAANDWDGVNNTYLFKMTERTGVDWCNGMSVHHMVFDGALKAKVCVVAERCITSSFYSNQVTRYTEAGVRTLTACYNFNVLGCLIEYMPWPFISSDANPIAGVDFQEVDNLVTSSTIIGNINGIKCPRKTRIIGNHMYGNKYSVYSVSNLIIITGNYVEDPIWLKGGRDCTIDNNFFSESIKGTAFILEYDGLGTGTGTSLIGNTRAQYDHVKTGDITLSGLTGTVTITSTATDFMNFPVSTHVHEGAVIKAGSGVAYIRSVAANRLSCTAVVVKAFDTLSFTNTNWAIEESLYQVFDAPSNIPVGMIVRANRNSRNLTADVSAATTINDGRPENTAYGFYDWTQGNGKGDWWLGTNTNGLGIGVITSGANQGLVSIWAKGTTEWIVFGGATAGQMMRITPTAVEPGVTGTFQLGSSSRMWSIGHMSEVRLGTNIRVLSGAGSPEGVVAAARGSQYNRNDGAAVTTLYVKESGTGNTGWVAK